MRRKDREVTSFEEIIKIIDECQIIRLGLTDKNDSLFPYIVPVNFAYKIVKAENSKCGTENPRIEFYIHGAMAGRKYELLKTNQKCSFEMDLPLALDCIVEKKDATMRYKSVMGKAQIQFLEDKEKEDAVDQIIMARYEQTRNFDYNRAALPRTAVVRLTVTEITAKANPLNGTADL